MECYFLAKIEAYEKGKLNTFWQLCYGNNFTDAMQRLENTWGDDIASIEYLAPLTDLCVTLPESAIDFIKERNNFDY